MPARISVAEADRILAAEAGESRTVRCPLDKATGRILREPLVADRDLPPFDRVMMDGFAIRYEDLTSESFTVSGQQMAGSPATALSPQAGSAVEIMTGSVLPKGANTVVPYEDTSGSNGTFSISDPKAVEPGQFVHRKGSDHRKQETLLNPGRAIGPVETGIAASCGYTDVRISQLPRITIFGTGDELVPVHESPAPHQIRQSNALAVQAALLCAGFPCGTVLHLQDDAESESGSLQTAIRESDIVVISGAVSKGRRDWIPEALDELGDCRFHGVAQRPGKPMGFWKAASGCAVFALPGNPVSTIVATHRYIIPFLKRRQGELSPPPSRLMLGEPFSFDKPLTLFLPVKRDKEGAALPRPVNNSGDYAGLADSDGFVELEAARDQWPAGTTCEFHPWMT